jgi:hypothetical protein
MRMMVRIAVLVLWLVLSGCVSGPDAASILRGGSAGSYDTVAGATKVVPDPHAGWTRVIGPAVLVDGVVGGRRYVAVGWTDPKDPKGDDSFELQASSGFPRRVFLKQAYAEGRKLPTTIVDRDPVYCGPDCFVIETVSIRLSAAEMARRARTGLSFEVIGRRETIRMDVPASYFAAVLAAHRRHRGETG